MTKHLHPREHPIGNSEGIEITDHVEPVLYPKADHYGTLNVFGKGLLVSPKKEKIRHVGHTIEGDTVTRRKLRISRKIPKPDLAALFPGKNQGAELRWLNKLKDKFTLLRRDKIKTPEKWSSHISSRLMGDSWHKEIVPKEGLGKKKY